MPFFFICNFKYLFLIRKVKYSHQKKIQCYRKNVIYKMKVLPGVPFHKVGNYVAQEMREE